MCCLMLQVEAVVEERVVVLFVVVLALHLVLNEQGYVV